MSWPPPRPTPKLPNPKSGFPPHSVEKRSKPFHFSNKENSANFMMNSRKPLANVVFMNLQSIGLPNQRWKKVLLGGFYQFLINFRHNFLIWKVEGFWAFFHTVPHYKSDISTKHPVNYIRSQINVVLKITGSLLVQLTIYNRARVFRPEHQNIVVRDLHGV